MKSHLAASPSLTAIAACGAATAPLKNRSRRSNLADSTLLDFAAHGGLMRVDSADSQLPRRSTACNKARVLR